MDSLLENLGQSSHRKGFRKDLLVPCKASDFAGLKDEYIRTYRRDVFRVRVDVRDRQNKATPCFTLYYGLNLCRQTYGNVDDTVDPGVVKTIIN
jgi:hypothetical protein